ncbi:MAG: MFS transporter [Rhodospirillaceae bacterium]|jgi:MFS family permease|nr:MFS transporter [Rhodospirillaceae bacterium]MBT3494894.1 MFS transporter [Rhodospirillaceae bacterium]MBT3781925.1 MFS transporter [Rhodospirillaceae bacterium]MBT3975609.1 MFS transporter [Rhodospirillaceae bacterium]MBT4561775.1 MFS transporter [Rhodospirillaceae bacterium]
MKSLALSINRRFFYGWVILAVAALGIFVSGPGQSHTFSVFLVHIQADLGLSATTVSSAYAFATLVAAFGLPWMGRLLDRIGPRRMLLGVSLLLGLACAAFGAAAGFLWLAVGFAALRFLGQGSLMLTSSNMISHWFDRKRGFALGLMAMGFSASMAVHPPLSQWLIDTVGWREAWVWLGVSTWVLMMPPVLFLVHNRPEDLGLLPDGDGTAASSEDTTATAAAETGLTLREALATSTFWILCAGLFGMSMLVTSLHFFQVSILTTQGLGEAAAARIFPISALVMIIAIPLVGRALDRFPTKRVFTFGLVVMITSLTSASQVHDLPTAIIYAVAFGLNNGCTMTFFGYVWPRYFGRKHLGAIQGTGQMIAVTGASIGPIPLAIAFDLLGSYSETLLALALYPASCAIIALLFLKTPARLLAQQQSAELE